MRYYNYLNEAKYLQKTMLGYHIDYNQIKSTSLYIKSFFDRYNVKYNINTNPHLTIAQMTGKYEKDEIVRTMSELPVGFTMKAKKVKMLYGQFVKKYFVTIEYNRSVEYIYAHNLIRERFKDVKTFPGGMIPHVSLFNMEEKDIDPYIWNEIDQRKINLPDISLNKIVLFNSKFLPEFLLK